MQADDKLKFLRNQSRSEQERVLRADLNRRPDLLWQENPPRVLAYKPSAVHQYGWIPFNPFNTRNFKATVFSSPLLNIQSVVLVAWAAFLHGTGCWVDPYDARAFLKIWGTVFAGAVFNLATIVVFILGLFTTLVINRWWSLRTAHAKLVSASLDLTIMVAHSIRDAQDFKNPRVMAARKELVRLINLAHILVCISGDGANHVFAQRPIVKAFERLFEQGGSARRNSDDYHFGRHMGALGFQTLNKYGLVNADEWQTILTNDAYGMPRYVTVMYWVEALLHQCRASEYMLTPQQMLPPMLAKVSTIVDNASTIFTFLRSQLPFPYVHLVSFTVHFYLFFWATYMGMLLHTGIPDGTVTQAATTQPLSVGTAADDAWELLQGQDQLTTSVRHAHRADGWFNMLWTYLSIAFANVVFQGLLNIHVLLDNPFGDHCCKFPLRSHVVELLNSSRTLLARADMLPQMFTDIFGDGGTPDGVEQPLPSAAADSRDPGSSEGSFQPAGAPFPGHVETMSDLGRLSEQDLAAMAGALIQGTAPAQLLSTGGSRPAAAALQRRSSPYPFQHGTPAQPMLYEVGSPELRYSEAPDRPEDEPLVTMRRAASAAPFATDLQPDAVPAAKPSPKKPMLHRMSAPFRFQGTSQSSGHNTSRDTTPSSRGGRGRSIMRGALPRKPPGAARTPPRAPSQPYVHFKPSTLPPHAANPADGSSDGSQEDDPLSVDSAAAPYDHQPPQPRSPVASGPSGPSGRSPTSGGMGAGLSSDTGAEGTPDEGGRGAGAAAPRQAGAGGPFGGTAVAVPVPRKQVEGGVVAEARVQRPRDGSTYGGVHGVRRSRSVGALATAAALPGGPRTPGIADSVHLRGPPGSAVLKAVQARTTTPTTGAAPSDADTPECSATVAFDRATTHSPTGDALGGHGSMEPSGGLGGDGSGRRWFSMFARRASSMRASSEGALGAPASAPVLASMHGGAAVPGALIGMSTDVAQRRIGTQAVFNPAAHVNEDDAEFLRSTPALSNGSAGGDSPLEEIREPAQPSGSPALARTSELADISGSGTQSSLSLPIDKRQVLPNLQTRL